MEFDKKSFAHFLLEEKVLLFGEFTLKSGRQSPHFFNSGRLDNGRALGKLGEHLAKSLKGYGGADIIFGPAYKGIPLAVCVATAYDQLYGTSTGVLFNRKETKTHGDQGLFVGSQPDQNSKMVLVDDVISSGISLKESIALLDKHYGVKPQFALVCVDRQEKGSQTDLSASKELEELTGVPCHCLITLQEVVQLMKGASINGEVIIDDQRSEKVMNYLETYGSC